MMINVCVSKISIFLLQEETSASPRAQGWLGVSLGVTRIPSSLKVAQSSPSPS